jgi:porphobilinogen deaminase
VVRLATRGSPLALWQARRVAALLHRVGVASDLVVIETVGDRRADVPLEALGGQGVFVKEIQAAVAAGHADAAVHSAKDLPASPELAVPGRTAGTSWWVPPSTHSRPGRRWPPARPAAGSSWPTCVPT